MLDKALDLFLEHGFERTSMEAITVSAGMAKRTVYARYADKDALFKAALTRAIEEWILPVEELRAAETDDLEETLQRIGQILVANIMKPEGLRLMRITNAESGRMPEIGAFTYRQGTESTVNYLADLFSRRIGPSATPMAEWTSAATAFLYLVITGPPTMTAWGMKVDQQQIISHTNYSVQIFLNGLLPRRADKPDSELTELQNENRRLKDLLVATMLEIATLKEHQPG